MKVCLIGTGSFGSAMAILLARNALGPRPENTPDVTTICMYVRNPELYPIIMAKKTLPRDGEFAKVAFPANISFTMSLADALADASYCVFAVPSRYSAASLEEMAPYFPRGCKIVSLVKGFFLDESTLEFKRITQLIKEKLNIRQEHIASLGGPNIYSEILDNYLSHKPKYRPTNAVIASSSSDTANEFQALYFATGVLRTYTSQDVVASEICGALKNVYAIAAGYGDHYDGGVGTGVNFKAALVTRAAYEMGYFARAFGASQDSVYGLAGIGDLMASCQSGRNWRGGRALASGKEAAEVESEMQPNELEGFQTVKVVKEFLNGLRKRNPSISFELPILEEVYDLVFKRCDFQDGVRRIIDRPMKMERRSDPYITAL